MRWWRSSDDDKAARCVSLSQTQERGFRWLANLCDVPAGCILADDMGLGKTCQTLALFLHLKDSGRLGPSAAGGGRGAPALVICPATLLSNWASEAAKFAPTLRVHVHHGASRGDIGAVAGRAAQAGGAAKKQKTGAAGSSASNSAPGPDLVLTSYGTLRTEVDSFKKCSFAIVVVDEGQVIKNPAAAVTKAVKSVPAPLRVALSGTPVENRLVELWSLMCARIGPAVYSRIPSSPFSQQGPQMTRPALPHAVCVRRDFAYPGFLGSAKDFAK